MPVSAAYRPEPRVPDLGPHFADPVEPARFPRHVLRFRNDRWAARVGLDTLSPVEWEAAFARFEPLPGNVPAPLAMRYHGHQFRTYNPELGDGRGFLFAQLRDDAGRLLDLGTKGSGRTPWSRGGDGRLTLKGGVREVLATELLEALGVPTSKTFSVFETGESLTRHDEPSPTRACVLVRLSHGHVRFGSFQRHAHGGHRDRLRALLEHAVLAYYPELASEADLPLAFFRAVRARKARTVGAWMAAGFVHGVLNTDNMNVTGESFDYGPWRFLPHYDPRFTAAYFDHSGLYAYGRQPEAVAWNLARLGECLALLSPGADWEGALAAFQAEVASAIRDRFLWRLGVAPLDPDTDDALVGATLELARWAGFAQLFHDFRGGAERVPRAREGPAAAAYSGGAFEAFRRLLELHPPLPRADDDPIFDRARPCDMRIEEVEEIWSRIDRDDDWEAFAWKVGDMRRLGLALASADEG